MNNYLKFIARLILTIGTSVLVGIVTFYSLTTLIVIIFDSLYKCSFAFYLDENSPCNPRYLNYFILSATVVLPIITFSFFYKLFRKILK